MVSVKWLSEKLEPPKQETGYNTFAKKFVVTALVEQGAAGGEQGSASACGSR